MAYLIVESFAWVSDPSRFFTPARVANDLTSRAALKREWVHVAPDVRGSMAVMALGMGYMLVAMQTMHMPGIAAVMVTH